MREYIMQNSNFSNLKKDYQKKDLYQNQKQNKKRKLTQEDINYLMEKHAYCLKLLEDK